VAGDLLVLATEPDLDAEGVEIIEQPTRLVLLHVEARQPDEATRVVPASTTLA